MEIVFQGNRGVRRQKKQGCKILLRNQVKIYNHKFNIIHLFGGMIFSSKDQVQSRPNLYLFRIGILISGNTEKYKASKSY